MAVVYASDIQGKDEDTFNQYREYKPFFKNRFYDVPIAAIEAAKAQEKLDAELDKSFHEKMGDRSKDEFPQPFIETVKKRKEKPSQDEFYYRRPSMIKVPVILVVIVIILLFLILLKK